MRLAVISDVHVLSPNEQEKDRVSAVNLGKGLPPLRRSWRRGLNRMRARFWNWHPDPRRDCFIKALEEVAAYDPDWVIANGDYGGDTSGVGLSDESTFESAQAVISAIRDKFPKRSHFVFGDHELGKYSTVLREGGIRIRSLQRGEEQLGIRSFWHLVQGDFHLIGMNSSLLVLDLFLPEALESEIPEWERRRKQHIREVCSYFDDLPENARVILFCHDPSALAVMATLPPIQRKIHQVERTVLGHLHAPGLLRLVKLMPKVPRWKPKYPVARIISNGLRDAHTWKVFRPIVCPSTFGAGKHISGGILFIETGFDGDLIIRRHRISN